MFIRMQPWGSRSADITLMRYIRQYNEALKAVKWKYFDPTRRITCESVVAAQ